MSISVHFPEYPIDPSERLAALMDNFGKARDAQLQELLEAGISKERISIVTLDACLECQGAGVVVEYGEGRASVTATIRTCHSCPGICVDGKAIARMPRGRQLP